MVKKIKEPENQLWFVKPLFIIMALILVVYCIYYFTFQYKPEPENNAMAPIAYVCTMPEMCQIYYLGQEGSPSYDGICHGTIRIGHYQQEINMCINHIFLRYEDLKDILNGSRSYSNGITDESKIKEYLDRKGFFFVNNPNTQIEMSGDISLKGTGKGSYYSCGTLFCSSGSSSMDLDLNGKITLNGQLKAPVSFVDESRLNELNNGNDYVKCYIQSFGIYTSDNKPLQKLICGIEKNNVFVVAEIESIESKFKTCSIMDVDMYEGDYIIRTLKINPGITCSEIWK